LRKLTWFFSFRDSEPNIKLLSKMLKTQIPWTHLGMLRFVLSL
jgi:hypothetical protein